MHLLLSTKQASAKLQEIFDVDEGTACAMLTIAASEIGEYALNGIQVRADYDEQKFSIRSLDDQQVAETVFTAVDIMAARELDGGRDLAGDGQ